MSAYRGLCTWRGGTQDIPRLRFRLELKNPGGRLARTFHEMFARRADTPRPVGAIGANPDAVRMTLRGIRSESVFHLNLIIINAR